MELPHDAVLLRIFIGEQDRWEGKPLYDAIVMRAREEHMAGATVLRGAMGYGHATRLHRANFLDISEDLPVIIEIVETEAKINAFLPILDSMMGSGLVTLEKVGVIQYGRSKNATTP
jgi:PII-like signaling protein